MTAPAPIRTAVPLLLAAVALLAAPQPAVGRPGPGHKAAAVKQPSLAITVDSGREALQSGDRITYRTELKNLGVTATAPLQISQTLATGMKLVSSTPDGTAKNGRVLWTKAVPAGGTVAFRTIVEVGEIPAQFTRLAAVACASAKADARPIVCSTRADRVVRAATATTGTAVRPWYAAVAGGVLLVAAALLARRRSRRSPGRHA